jgi:hypothetical protein
VVVLDGVAAGGLRDIDHVLTRSKGPAHSILSGLNNDPWFEMIVRNAEYSLRTSQFDCRNIQSV